MVIKILIAEDDTDIAALIKLTLNNAGYLADIASDGEAGADMIETGNYSLALVDIMLPKIDGYELSSYIREFSVPVIFVTAKGTIEDKTAGFRLGADDYIVKPFEPEELVLRVENILRLRGIAEEIFRFKNVEINVKTRTAAVNGVPAQLTPKEYELLILLFRNKNVALHRQVLYERVWGDDCGYDTRTLDIHIRRLRQKLGLAYEIKTVYKFGYMLEVES